LRRNKNGRSGYPERLSCFLPASGDNFWLRQSYGLSIQATRLSLVCRENELWYIQEDRPILYFERARLPRRPVWKVLAQWGG